MAGVCFTMQPEQIHVACRNKGTIRTSTPIPTRCSRDGPLTQR